MSSCQVGYITGILMDSLKEELAGDTAIISLAGSVQVKIKMISIKFNNLKSYNFLNHEAWGGFDQFDHQQF